MMKRSASKIPCIVGARIHNRIFISLKWNQTIITLSVNIFTNQVVPSIMAAGSALVQTLEYPLGSAREPWLGYEYCYVCVSVCVWGCWWASGLNNGSAEERIGATAIRPSPASHLQRGCLLRTLGWSWQRTHERTHTHANTRTRTCTLTNTQTFNLLKTSSNWLLQTTK